MRLTSLCSAQRRGFAALASPYRSPRAPCVTFIGGGAIGCLFAALLSQSPIKHRAFVLSQHLADTDTITVRLLSHATVAIQPVVVRSAQSLVADDSWRSDIVIASVKGVDAIHRAVSQVTALTQPHSHSRSQSQSQPQSVIVPVMNGIAHIQPFLSLQSPSRQVVFVSTSQGAYWSTDTDANSHSGGGCGGGRALIQAGDGLTTLISPPSETETSAGADTSTGIPLLTSLFRSADVPLAVANHSQLHATLWKKLLVNCVLNPLTALLNVRNGAIEDFLHTSNGQSLIDSLLREVIAVASTQGIAFDYDREYANLLVVARATAPNVNSMLSDVRSGRLTEIDSINGEIVRIGASTGVPTPVNAMLCQLMARRDLRAGLMLEQWWPERTER